MRATEVPIRIGGRELHARKGRARRCDSCGPGGGRAPCGAHAGSERPGGMDAGLAAVRRRRGPGAEWA